MRYVAISLFLLPLFARASDQTSLFIGGSQVSELNSFTYVGVLQPLSGGKIGDGWFRKVIASWLTYEYDTFANNQDVTAKARAPGIEAGMGYSWAGERYAVSLALSGGYRYIRLKPNLPDEDPQGDVFTLTPDVQARYKFSEYVDTDILSSYAFGQQASFNRIRLGLHPDPKWRVGLETFFQKGRNYSSKQLGVFVSSYLSNGMSYELSGGMLRNGDGVDSPYLGIGVAKFF